VLLLFSEAGREANRQTTVGRCLALMGKTSGFARVPVERPLATPSS